MGFRATIAPVSGPFSFVQTLESARSGDREAQNELATRFYPSVQQLVHHRLAVDLRRGRAWLNAHFSTGDVVQSVFERVLADLRAFKGSSEDAFVAYLAVVVQHKLIDALRFHEAAQRDARRSSRLSGGYDAASPGPDPAEEVADADELLRLREAITALDAREQHLVRARMDGLATFSELAEQLGYGSESGARRAFFDLQAKLLVRLKEGR